MKRQDTEEEEVGEFVFLQEEEQKRFFLKKSLTFKYQAKVICWPTFVALEILDSVYLFWKSLIQLFFKNFIYLFFIFDCVRS